jgi:hypothetical protein
MSSGCSTDKKQGVKPMARNLFKGVQIIFQGTMIDHSVHNAQFDRDGFRQFMLPATETSIQLVERELSDYLSAYEMKWEREFTVRKDGMVTMYISSGKTPNALTRSQLARMQANGTLTSVVYGSMKTDATFVA